MHTISAATDEDESSGTVPFLESSGLEGLPGIIAPEFVHAPNLTK
jgi:hypothetical protein